MNITLARADGTTFGAYLARPATPKGGAVVVLQEIFGVNRHIRSVADRFAEAGYLAIAPCLFDRAAPGIELGYESADIARGRDIKNSIALDDSLADIAAGIAAVREGGPVAVVGFCWGGFLAWQAAAKCAGLSAAVVYYGGGIVDSPAAELTPQVPMLLHFGRRDGAIPLPVVEAMMAARPELPIHLYDAGHGFNCDRRGSYDAASAGLALTRTLAFLEDKLRG